MVAMFTKSVFCDNLIQIAVFDGVPGAISWNQIILERQAQLDE